MKSKPLRILPFLSCSNSVPVRRSLLRPALAAAVLAGLCGHASAQTTYFWDNNGSTPGFGTANGTWSTPTTNDITQGWNTDPTGGNAGGFPTGNTTTTSTDSLSFGTATDGLSAGANITVSGTVNANSLTFGSVSGNTTLSGGNITMGGTTPTITTDNTADTITSVLFGSAGLTKNGTGTLILAPSATGAQWSGTTNVNAGTLTLGNPGGDNFKSAQWNIASGATLKQGNANTIVNTAVINIAGGGTFMGNFDSIGTLAGSGNVTVNSASGQGLTLSSGTQNFSGVIQNNGSGFFNLIINGANQTLSGNNTYSGSTTITAGLLQVASAENVGTSGPLGKPSTLANSIILNGGTLQFSAANTYDYTTSGRLQIADAKIGIIDTNGQSVTFANAIAVGAAKTGAITKNGTGTLILSGNNTFTGAVTINDGTLKITNSNALGTGTKTVTATNNAGGAAPNLTLDGSGGDITLASSISFTTSGAILKNAAGNNTVTGNLSMAVGNGDTVISSDAGSLTLSGTIAPITSARSLRLGGNGNASVTGLIKNGTGNSILAGVKKDSGSGTWTFSNNNTYTSATTVSAGTLAISNDNNLGAAWTGGIQTLSFSAAGSGLANGTISLTLSAPNLPGGVQATANATVTGGAITAVTLTNAGTGYTSAPTITPLTGTTNGTIVASIANLNLSATLQTNAAVTSSRAVTLSGAAGTINTNGFDSTFSGPLTGSGALTKSGSGTLALSANNTFSGVTTVSAGTLLLSGGGAINATSGISVATGATLTNNSSVTVTPALTLTEGAALSGSNAFNPLSMTLVADLSGGIVTPVDVSASLAKPAALNFTLTNITDGSYSFLSGAGPVTGSFASVSVGGSPLADQGGGIFAANVGGVDYTFTDATNILVVAVPEPGTCILVGIGLTCLLHRKPGRRLDA